MKEIIIISFVTNVVMFVILVMLKMKVNCLEYDVKQQKNEKQSLKRIAMKYNVDMLNAKEEAKEYRYLYNKVLNELADLKPKRGKDIKEFQRKWELEKEREKEFD